MSEPHFNGPLAQMLRRLAIHTPADPWPDELNAAVRAPTAVSLCINCLAPQSPPRWSCPHCAFPTGDYVAVTPYIQLFLVGEIFRQGVTGPPERRLGTQLFLVIFSLSEYAFFAPVYWFWMYRRAIGKPIRAESRLPLAPTEPPDAVT